MRPPWRDPKPGSAAALEAGPAAADSSAGTGLRPTVDGARAGSNGHAKPASVPSASRRPRVQGKFLYVGEEKLYLRGVTYGTFRPGEGRGEYPEPQQVAADFR